MKEKQTYSEKETFYLGYQLGLLLKPSMVVLLDGELATGKTTFTKGIGKALNINQIINSPTFTILKRYISDETKFYHIDLYRLKEEASDFDIEDYIYSDAITVIEWPFNVKSILPKEYLLVTFKYISDETRKLIFQAFGKRYESVVKYI